jgi:hypothetical protein
MIELYLDDKVAIVNSNSTIKLTTENPYFSTSSSYTYEVELPLLIAQNREIFGMIHRKDITKKSRTLTARLVVDNEEVLTGSAVIKSISESSVKVQLLGAASAYNYNNKMSDVYVDELDLGDWMHVTDPDFEPTRSCNDMGNLVFNQVHNEGYNTFINRVLGGIGNKWVAYPICNSNNDRVFNAYIFKAATTLGSDYRLDWPNGLTSARRNEFDADNAPWLYWSVQPFLWVMVKKVAEATGLTIEDEDNIFATDELYKRIFIANAHTHNLCNKCLPHWSVADWWSYLEDAFGVVVYINDQTSKVRIIPRWTFYNEITEQIYINDVEDEYSVDVEDDADNDISVCNVGFADFDGDAYEKLEEAPLSVATINEDFENLSALRAWAKGLSDISTYNDTLFKCADGRQYIYTDNKLSTGAAFVEVNQYRDRIVDDEDDDIDVEIKVVPCCFIEYDAEVHSRPRSSAGSSATQETKLATMTVKILSRPDREDSMYSSTCLEDIIEGDEDVEQESSNDLLYVAMVGGYDNVTANINDADVNFQYPRAWAREFSYWDIVNDKIATEDKGYSFGLNKVSNQLNLYSQSLNSSLTIDTKVKQCFKFLSNKIPNPLGTFTINNKRYVCEKLEANLTADGLDKLITGYFYEIL